MTLAILRQGQSLDKCQGRPVVAVAKPRLRFVDEQEDKENQPPRDGIAAPVNRVQKPA